MLAYLRKVIMSLILLGKYICDAAGKEIEVILPVHEFREELSAAEMTQIALQGGAFDWLKNESDLYSDADGKPV
ncbi:hypothetical protein L0244_20640 [bacterium]|nr:hypothetical protein [bacterium]